VTLEQDKAVYILKQILSEEMDRGDPTIAPLWGIHELIPQRRQSRHHDFPQGPFEANLLGHNVLLVLQPCAVVAVPATNPETAATALLPTPGAASYPSG
jgi:hypothetical protein